MNSFTTLTLCTKQAKLLFLLVCTLCLFQIQTDAQCPVPSTLPLSNISITDVDFNWQENGTATEWDLEWGDQGFTQGTGTQLYGLTNTTQNLSGLIYLQSYDVYVRSNCGSETSNWVGPFNFLVTYVGESCANFVDMNTVASPMTFTMSNYLDDFSHCSLGGSKDIVLCADLAPNERLTVKQTSSIDANISLRSGPCLSGATEVCNNDYYSDFELEPFVYDNRTVASKQVCFFMAPTSSSYNGDMTVEWSISTALPLAINDNCANATSFGTVPASGTCPGGVAIESVDFSTASLTTDIPSCSYSSYDLRDVFYSFTAPSTGAVKFNMTYPAQFANSDVIYVGVLYDACSGTELSCQQGYGSQNSMDFSGMTAGNDYIIRFILRTDTDEYSNIQADICLEETCPKPDGFTETSLTGTSADLNWNANGTSEWELEWSDDYSTLNSGGGTIVTGITSLPYTLSGLSGGVGYYYRVKSVCTVSTTSDWVYDNFVSAPVGENCNNYLDLATVTSPYTFSADIAYYLNDISTPNCYATNNNYRDLVACIDLADGERLIISGELISSSSWSTDNISGALEAGPCGTGTNLFCENIADTDEFYYDNTTGATQQVCYIATQQGSSEYGNVEFTWSVSLTPPPPSNDECANPTAFGTLPAEGSCPGGLAVETVDFSAVPVSASTFSPSCHYYALHDVFYSFEAPSTGAAKFSISNIVGGNYPSFGLALFDACNGTQLSCESYVYANTSYNFSNLTAGNTYIVQFYFKQDYSNDENPFVEVDVCMEAACPAPTGMTVSNATTNTAEISWTANGASLWDIEYSTSYSFYSNNTLISGITSSPYTATGLTQGTTYYARIRPDCGGASPSAWSSIFYIQTLANGDNCNNYIDLATETSPYTFSTNIYNFADDFTGCNMSSESDLVLCIDLAHEEQMNISAEIPGYSASIRASLEVGSCGTGTQVGCGSYNADGDQFAYANYSGATEQVCFFVGQYDGGGNVVVTWAVSQAPPMPTNTECADAIDLGLVLDEGSCPNTTATDTINFTAVPQSPSSDGPNCEYYAIHDVFYTFEAPSTGAMKADINYISSNVPSQYSTDFNFAVYDACSGNQVACDDASFYYDAILTGMTPGNTYILQFYHPSDYYGTAAHNYEAGFCLEATCPAPAYNALSTTNITTTTADATWTGTTNGTWEIEWGTKGFSLGTGTQITGVTGNSYTLTGLPTGSRLSYYLRNNCGASSSGWTGPHHFITQLACGQNFTDSGGILGDYSNYEDETFTICPTVPTDKAYIEFTQFAISSGDGLTFYNGNSTSASTIRTPNGSAQWSWLNSYGTGNLAGKRIVSTSPDGCLTIRIQSNGSSVAAGFNAIVNCIAAPGYPTTVVPQDAGLVTSDKAVITGDEWTHYINEASGYILLSLFEPTTRVDIPTSGVTVGAGSGVVDMSSAPYVLDDTWRAMDRYWDVNATTQPYYTDINVRFYYSTEDYDDVANIMDQNINDHTDMTFYKINGNYDPDPNNGHAGVNEANDYDENGYWEYENGTTASNYQWAYTAFGNGHCAEFKVRTFSGGGAGAAQNGNGALPVELLDFTATPVNNKKVVLAWSTASELNNKGFFIERSKDGETWESIGFVEGFGTSTERNEYGFDDTNPVIGVNYYRLKQMDFDGAFEYSKVTIAEIEQSNEMVIHPNPSKGGKIYLSFKTETTGTLSIFNSKGQLVLSQQVDSAEGNYRVDLPNLRQGIYIAELSTESEQLVSRFIIQE